MSLRSDICDTFESRGPEFESPNPEISGEGRDPKLKWVGLKLISTAVLKCHGLISSVGEYRKLY